MSRGEQSGFPLRSNRRFEGSARDQKNGQDTGMLATGSFLGFFTPGNMPWRDFPEQQPAA